MAQGWYRACAVSVDRLCAALSTKAEEEITSITEEDLLCVRNTFASEVLAISANKYFKIVRRIFRAAKKARYLVHDPAEFVEPLKPSAAERAFRKQAFSLDQVRLLLEHATPEWKTLIYLGLYTGQRLGDLVRLAWNQVDLERDEIHFHTQKTGRKLIVPIAPALKRHLLELPSSDSPDAPVNPQLIGWVTPNGVTSLSNQFAQILIRAGIREPVTAHLPGKRQYRHALSFHSLRHTAVSLLKAADVPHVSVQELIGHTSSAVSRIYTHVDLAALHKAAQQLPDIG